MTERVRRRIREGHICVEDMDNKQARSDNKQAQRKKESNGQARSKKTWVIEYERPLECSSCLVNETTRTQMENNEVDRCQKKPPSTT